MKQIKINGLWTTSVAFHTIYDFWKKGFNVNDVVSFSWLNEEKQKVAIYKNGQSFNVQAKGLSKPTNTTSDDDVSFGTMREKIELGIYMGLLVPPTNFDPRIKKDFVNSNYKFVIKDANITDWIFKYLDSGEGIDPFGDLPKAINSIVLRSLWMYKKEEFRAMLPENIDPILGLLMLKRSNKFAAVDVVINNIKSYPKIYSNDSENSLFLNNLLSKYEITIDPNVFDKATMLKLKYSSIFNMFNLTNEDIRNQKPQTSFQNDPWSARKLIEQFEENVAIELVEKDDKYELMLNDIKYHSSPRSVGTIFWNLWGLILNGNFSLKEWMFGKTEKEFVRSFIGKVVIAKSYQSVNVIKSNYSLMNKNNDSYIATTTISFFINGYKNLLTPTEAIKDRSVESIKFVDDFNKYEFNVKQFSSFKKKKHTEKYDSILKLRSRFSKKVNDYYKSVIENINTYTSVNGVEFESTDKAHIFEVSEAKKIEDYDSIVDPQNCLLLSPNIHRLWDKGYLRIRPDGKIVTNDNQETKYELNPLELKSSKKVGYLETRYLMDLEKNSQKKLSANIHFLK